MSPDRPHPYGIYVHVPWCRARCPYCAFNVQVDAQPDVQGWLDGLRQAWETERQFFTGEAHSLYLGGGTPSLLPTAAIEELVAMLPLSPDAEITLEANPGTVSLTDLQDMVSAGINRVSIGVQSLQSSVARRLGRGHTTEQARDLLRSMASLSLRSWSFDLIFGVPEQTLEQLQADLTAIIEFSPPHVSLYGLTIEPGTPFAQMVHSGSFTLPEADAWRAQYDLIVQVLTDNGWTRYEVSNFAKPGHRGHHNEQVWRGGWYAGLGPGAHGHRPDGSRTTTENDVASWQSSPTSRINWPTPSDAAVDHLLSTLRHMDGTMHRALLDVTGHRLCEQTVDNLKRAGLLHCNNEGIRLTHAGFPLADGILRRLCTSLRS